MGSPQRCGYVRTRLSIADSDRLALASRTCRHSPSHTWTDSPRHRGLRWTRRHGGYIWTRPSIADSDGLALASRTWAHPSSFRGAFGDLACSNCFAQFEKLFFVCFCHFCCLSKGLQSKFNSFQFRPEQSWIAFTGWLQVDCRLIVVA